jgi:hypothetical protein
MTEMLKKFISINTSRMRRSNLELHKFAFWGELNGHVILQSEVTGMYYKIDEESFSKNFQELPDNETHSNVEQVDHQQLKELLKSATRL